MLEGRTRIGQLAEAFCRGYALVPGLVTTELAGQSSVVIYGWSLSICIFCLSLGISLTRERLANSWEARDPDHRHSGNVWLSP